MYMSRVEIDFKNRLNLKKLSNINAYHSWVEECFPDEFEEKSRTRKLWRIDNLNGKTYLLIVSEKEPDLQIIEKFGVKGSGEIKNYDLFLDKLEEGAKAYFKVVLNPIVSIKESKNDKSRGKIVPLKSEDYNKYLMDRSKKNGFSLKEEEFLITDRKILNFKHTKKSKKIKLNKVTYEGKLTITDRDKMIDTLTKGMGKKKAYGFGMMTLILEK